MLETKDSERSRTDGYPTKESLWPMVLAVAGVYWLVTAIADVLVYRDFAGRTYLGQWVPHASGILFAYFLEFLALAPLYYWTLRLGWPKNIGQRAISIVLQISFAVIFVALSGPLSGLAIGLAEGRWERLTDAIEVRRNLSWDLIESAWRGAFPRYVLGALLVAFVRIARKYQTEALRAAKLSAEYANARLGMLSAQLQPHFLFNTLHMITELVATQPERATEMLEQLGVFLRHALDTSKRPWVGVNEEIAGLEAYLAVQQTRFGDRLAIDFSVHPAASGSLLPSLLLQPLVENAVEHGRAAGAETLLVRVAVDCVRNHLEIVISNSAPRLLAPLPIQSYGYGLHNVVTRLRAAYGDAAELSVGPGARGGTEAKLSLPLHRLAASSAALYSTEIAWVPADVNAPH